ncbi:MAG: hypothetical protein LBD94_01645 [Rickettsiales bacterium]|jgi:hypothetical protein|nr:hypothetical protein [Rickettsiales bacterium]
MFIEDMFYPNNRMYENMIGVSTSKRNEIIEQIEQEQKDRLEKIAECNNKMKIKG